MKTKLFLFLSLFSLSAHAAAPARNHCERFTKPVAWSYCVTTERGSADQNVLYILHGGGGGDFAKMRAETWDGLREEWAKIGKASPRIIQVSFGPIWALVPKDSNPHSGLLEIFVNTVMPHIEGKALRGHVGKRMIWGHSMGGLNGTILALTHPDLFAKIAMTSPAPIVGVSPFASTAEIEAYAARAEMPLVNLQHMLQQYAYFLGSDESFRKMSVVVAGPTVLGPQTPPFYISGSPADTYYYYGITELLRVVREAGVNVTWEELPGGHGDIDGPALAKFLTL